MVHAVEAGTVCPPDVPCTGCAGLKVHQNGVKYNTQSLELVFHDPAQVLATFAGQSITVSGFARDPGSGLNVCFDAAVRVCSA